MARFRIRDKQGREYGPVDAAELRSWIIDARLTADMLIQQEGLKDWIRAGDIPAIARLLAERATTIARGRATGASGGGSGSPPLDLARTSAQPGSLPTDDSDAHGYSRLADAAPPRPPHAPRPPQTPPPLTTTAASPVVTEPRSDPAMRLLLPVDRSVYAIVAGYLGLFSILGVFAPFALLFGILAIKDIRKHKHKHGMGRAVFGIVMGGVISVVLILVIIGLVLEKKIE